MFSARPAAARFGICREGDVIVITTARKVELFTACAAIITALIVAKIIAFAVGLIGK